jgi:hypothetical protein
MISTAPVGCAVLDYLALAFAKLSLINWSSMTKVKFFEWFGVITAIVYSMLVALNIGAEFVGFTLLLISAISIGIWAYLGKHQGILFLQLFYATAGIIGMFRWF